MAASPGNRLRCIKSRNGTAPDRLIGVMITDKLRSYGAAKKAAKREIMQGVPPGGHCLTARAPATQGLEQSGGELTPANKATRTTDEALQVGPQAQRFLSAHDPIANLFHLRRDHVTASQYRAARSQTFEAGPDRRRSAGRLITDQGCAHTRKRPHRGQTPIKLTVPSRAFPMWRSTAWPRSLTTGWARRIGQRSGRR